MDSPTLSDFPHWNPDIACEIRLVSIRVLIREHLRASCELVGRFPEPFRIDSRPGALKRFWIASCSSEDRPVRWIDSKDWEVPMIGA